MNFQDFYNLVIGKGYDIDGAYGAQCWDGYAKYCQWLGVPITYCSTSGGARDLWEQRHNNGILHSFTEVSSPKNGDVCVWNESAGTSAGHVAMYYNGGYLGQNQGGTPYPGGGAVFSVVHGIPAPMGYLRPKKDVGGEEDKCFWMKIVNGLVIECKVVDA